MSQFEGIYDLAIIGGGIAGAGIARDAALRGLKVVLLEKSTFGSGSSSKTSKLIHGGIRYLEVSWEALRHGRFSEAWKNFRFVFLALRETHILEAIAPGLVLPIPLIVPVYRDSPQSKWFVFMGTLLYFILARATGPVRPPKILWTKASVLKLLPNLNPESLTGGIMFWDRTTDDQELVRATLRSAIKNGAEAYEHTPLISYSFDAEDEIYELITQHEDRIKKVLARKVINAAGPWIDRIRQAAQERGDPELIPVAGSHITFKKFVNYSLVLEAHDGRLFFIINRDGTSRVGTTEWICKDPDKLQTPEEDIAYLLQSLKRYFPRERLDRKDILSADSGIRPLANPGNNSPLSAISREHEFRVGSTGVIHVLGVKLTDHRRAAEQLVNELVLKAPFCDGPANRKSISSVQPLDLGQEFRDSSDR